MNLNSKNKKIIILSIITFILAVVTGIAVYFYCNSSKTYIYMFKDNYAAGDKITKDMLSPLKIDSRIVRNGKGSNVSDYYITENEIRSVLSQDEYLLNNVEKDEPLMSSNLAFTSATQIERSLQDKESGVTIAISGAAAVTNKLRAGSIVDIYTINDTDTQMIFKNMKIISVESGDEGVTEVTFGAEDDEALKLIDAANNSKLYFTLKQPEVKK